MLSNAFRFLSPSWWWPSSASGEDTAAPVQPSSGHQEATSPQATSPAAGPPAATLDLRSAGAESSEPGDVAADGLRPEKGDAPQSHPSSSPPPPPTAVDTVGDGAGPAAGKREGPASPGEGEAMPKRRRTAEGGAADAAAGGEAVVVVDAPPPPPHASSPRQNDDDGDDGTELAQKGKPRSDFAATNGKAADRRPLATWTRHAKEHARNEVFYSQQFTRNDSDCFGSYFQERVCTLAKVPADLQARFWETSGRKAAKQIITDKRKTVNGGMKREFFSKFCKRRKTGIYSSVTPC
jgi:hypothetical protein